MSNRVNSSYGLTMVLEGMPNAVLAYQADDTGKIVYANRKCWGVFGCTSAAQFEQMSSQGFFGLLASADADRLRKFVTLVTEEKVEPENHMRYQVRQFDGTTRTVVDFGRLIADPTLGKLVVISYPPTFVQDEQNSRLSRDGVTGLMGMAGFLSRANAQLAEAGASAATYSITFFDVRNFKLFNLRYGAASGDAVLQDVAQILRQEVTGGLLGRLGDDHFVAMTPADDSTGISQRVCDEFRRLHEADGMMLQAGIYLLESASDDPKDATDFARIACESIHRSDKSVAVFARSMSARLERLSYISQNIEHAIEQGWIKVYFQPVVRTMSGKVCGAEALARWIDPELGFLSPADFIGELESSRKIHKLDLFVAKEICRLMSEGDKLGATTIPVSFNLSRYDFMACDMLAEIEALVSRYHIARDMINIEVTESMLVEDAEMIQREVDRFRAAGYEVWMDDFGSGYSSLNVLKNSRFDEIKLDMAFLDHLDERGKEIIVSIISMAKRIGIHTLAEGVETEEQLAFLKSIGCGKAQGYLIGKPAPLQQMIHGCLDRGVEVEGRDWRPYYDKLGEVDFDTDRTLAIVEYDGARFSFLFANDAMRSLLLGTGLADYAQVYNSVNAPTSSLSRQLRELQASLEPGGGFKEMHYVLGGQHLLLRACQLYRHAGHVLVQVELINMSLDDEKTNTEQMDYAFRLMYATFDSIYVLDRAHDTVEPIMQGAFGDSPCYVALAGAHVAEVGPAIADGIIHEDDRAEFLEWSDYLTAFERIGADEKGYLVRYFRTRTRNGSFAWMTHHLLYAGANDAVIYAIKLAPLNQQGLLQKLVPEEYRQRVQAGELFEQSLMESRAINFFWKDRERRYRGANKKFLSTFGIDDVSQVLGKTDEDMGWYIDCGPYHDEETDVIERGRLVLDSPGKCIVRGAVHNVISSKEPVYRDGQVVGLRGYITDLDQVLERAGSVVGAGVTDRVTGFMSGLGIMSAMLEYVEGWETRGEDFAIVRLGIPQYLRVYNTFGERTAHQLLAEVGKVLVEQTSNGAACARLYSGNFAIFLRFESKEAVRRLVAALAEQVSGIKKIRDHRVTVEPDLAVYFASEVGDVRQLVGMYHQGMPLEGEGR